jgi:hypothetical protein
MWEAGLCEPKRRDDLINYGKMRNGILISNIQRKSPYERGGGGFGAQAGRAKSVTFYYTIFRAICQYLFEKNFAQIFNFFL